MKRDTFTLPLGLAPELIIDNFAGGGGASEGMEQAFGRPVDIAINHDGEALAMHAANHPSTAHYQEDVFGVHPGFVTHQQPIAAAWFSPDCKHHSKAKGGKPREQKIRGLAWVTLKWAALQVPRCIFLENVEEFGDWGPLDEHGKPIASEKGRTFRAFLAALSTGLPADHPDCAEIYATLGADFPLHRLHAGLGYQVEWKVLRACDYGTPTIRKRLFLVARRDGRPIVWPQPTHGDPKSEAVKAGRLQPWRTAAECIDWSIPCPSIFERARPLKDATLRRIAKGIMKFVVNSADPFIVSPAHSKTTGRGPNVWPGDEPLRTVTSSNDKYVVQPIVAPVLTEHANASSPRCMPADEPLRTICAQVKGGHHALVAAHITKFRTGSTGSAIDEPIHTITAGGDCARPAGAAHAMGIVSAFLAKHYGGVVGTGVDVPTGTVTTSDHHSVVTAQLVGCGGRAGQSRPRDAGEPAATVTAKADTTVAVSHLVKLRNNQFGQDAREPAPTLTAGGGHLGEVRAFLIKYYGTGGQWQDLREPTHTIPTKDRLSLVTIRGEDYAIVDIGMRMLTPRELARAQGFPDSYILDPLVNGKPLTKTAQVRMIGNSVCPPMARALIEANFAHEREIARVA